MAYVSVAEWRPEQVTEWLKGLDNSIVSYIHWFSNNEVNGQQLLNLSPDELTHLGVYKLGHQELILEAVQHLRNFHYELDRENLQLLALKLSCAAHSLYSEVRDQAESSSVPTQIMADVANVIHNVKPLVSWLDRPPFSGQIQYAECKSQLLSLSLEMATSAQRDRFADRPVAEIRTCSSKLANLADSIIQDFKDPMILQPATLDLATIKKKAGEELDFFLVPSFHGIHQIGDMKLSSPAHQSGKIQQGDEIVQVNYQTVVGWSQKKVMALFEESPNDLLLTLKRRPRHVKIYGQIYMKPYRLPSRKRASPYSRWNDNLPSPRPELLTIPDFDTTRSMSKKIENNQTLSLEQSGTSSSSDEEFGQPSDSQSPTSMRLYLPKHRGSIQRRFTLSGPPRPSAQSEQFWRELQLERSWRSNQSNSQINNSSAQNVGSKEGNVDKMFQLRDKSASLGNSIASASSRSTSCVPFTKDRIGSVKFDLTKFEAFKSDKNVLPGEKLKSVVCDNETKAMTLKTNLNGEENQNKEKTSLSITELNKLKRNAFFNNMECSGNETEPIDGRSGKEGSSEKVKRVIENFKSEINKTKKDMSEMSILKSPGKVMELVENFERKENLNNGVKNKLDRNSMEKFVSPSKGTKEKSDANAGNCKMAAEIDDGFSRKKSVRSNDPKEEIGENSVVKKSDRSDGKRKIEIEVSGEAREEEIDSDVSIKSIIFNGKKITSDDKSSEKIIKNAGEEIGDREIVFPVNKSVDKLENRTVERTENSPDELSPSTSNKMDSKNEIPPRNPSTISQPEMSNKIERSDKPIPAQRKIKPSPEKIVTSGVANSNPFPLPPKPRTKFMIQSTENVARGEVSMKLPPEPPPRPDVTLSKSSNSKNNQSEARKEEETDLSRANSEFAVSGKGISVVDSEPESFSSPDSKSISSIPSSPVQRMVKTKSGVAATLPAQSFNSVSPEKEKQHKPSGSTLDSIKAMLTLVRKPINCKSPRTVRKKNSLLAKKRNVSVKEITPHENSGFLYYRNRKGSAVASWTKYFFVLQKSNFYGFKSRESNKADLFIHLPGFTCTLAEEVKSKDFSFKIYHTGTVFYFAANSKENLQQWLDSVSLAIFFEKDDKSGNVEEINYSQTDSENSGSDTEPEPETCFPTSPKMKKVLGSSSLPKPAASHQNLAADCNKKSQEIQKRFGSLKKLSSKKNANSNSEFSSAGENLEVASLDRKYLRFLGQRNSPLPVPTTGFRSYRRMHPVPVPSSKTGKSKAKSKTVENNSDTIASSNEPVRDVPVLARKPLHSSNPSLPHPEMADYRITGEKSSEFRRRSRNPAGNASEPNRFLRFEQFPQSSQDDAFRSGRNRRQELSGFITLEQFLLRQEVERQRSNKSQERSGAQNEFSNCDSPARESEEEYLKRDHPGQNIPGTSHQGNPNRPEKFQAGIRNKDLNSDSMGKSKNVSPCQFPLISPSSSSATQDDSKSEAMPLETIPDLSNSRMRKSNSNPSSSSSSVPICSSSSSDCPHSNKNSNSSCQGIEYPPAFEPETYTLQNMLKSRQIRSQEFKKNN